MAADSLPAVAVTAAYCLLVVAASLCGGALPSLVRLTHNRMQMMMSVVGGLMLGIGLFHMLPHAVGQVQSLDRAIWWMVVGLVTMFLLVRTFHFHQHGPVAVSTVEAPLAGDADSASGGPSPEHHHDHDHGHVCTGHEHDHGYHHMPVSQLSWLGVASGLSLHTLIDGIALAASVQAQAGRSTGWALFGFGTFLAILLHKPLDAVSITSLMLAGNWPARWRHFVNAGFALMCPLGAALFFVGLTRFTGREQLVVGCALAFSAGVFLCIALGDLLPEMEFHSHNRLPLTIALLLGIALAYAIGSLEPAHDHPHPDGISVPRATPAG